MGARLHYAKVVDREVFILQGGRVHPGLVNQVILDDEGGRAAAFLVMRAWTDDHGTFTEQWRIQAPGGVTIYKSLPRELHLATPTHIEKLEDELADLEFDYTDSDYTAVFLLDELEVARINFAVKTRARRR